VAGLAEAPELVTPQAVLLVQQQQQHRQPRRHDDPIDGSVRRMPLQQRSGPTSAPDSQRAYNPPHSSSQPDRTERHESQQASIPAVDEHRERRHDSARSDQHAPLERRQDAGPSVDLASQQQHQPQPHQQHHQQQQQHGRQQHEAQQQEPPRRRVREDENTVVVRNTRYTKLECVGRGGSSKVFKVRLARISRTGKHRLALRVRARRTMHEVSDDPSRCQLGWLPEQTFDPSQVMAPNRKIYALKRIKLQGRDAEAATGFIDEITLLQALRGKQNIIQLVDAEVRLPRYSCTALLNQALMLAPRHLIPRCALIAILMISSRTSALDEKVHRCLYPALLHAIQGPGMSSRTSKPGSTPCR